MRTDIRKADIRKVSLFLDRPHGKQLPTPAEAFAAGRRILAELGIEPPPTLTASWLGDTLRKERIL